MDGWREPGSFAPFVFFLLGQSEGLEMRGCGSVSFFEDVSDVPLLRQVAFCRGVVCINITPAAPSQFPSEFLFTSLKKRPPSSRLKSWNFHVDFCWSTSEHFPMNALICLINDLIRASDYVGCAVLVIARHQAGQTLVVNQGYTPLKVEET